MQSNSASKSYPASETVSGQSSQQRMIRRSASLTVTTENVSSAVTDISAMAENMGGWVVSSSVSQEYYRDGIYLPTADISIRVPSGQLNEALSYIKSFVADPEKDVSNEKITGTDITSDYVDTQSRLSALEATRDKLYEIMDTAENAEEALMVYSEIADIESDIEILKGQSKYMEESVAMSSISVKLKSVRPAATTVVSTWSIGEVFKDAFESLLELGKDAITLVVNFVVVGIPLLIIIFLPIYGIVRLIIWLVKKHKAKKAK